MKETAKKSFWAIAKQNLPHHLAELGVDEAQRAMRTAQIWRGLYVEGARDFSKITTLAKDFRSALNQAFDLTRPKIARTQISQDGTRKWLLQMKDQGMIETVFIPEEDRGTLCLSSQIGCTLTCRFCHTGTQRFSRNLSGGEIVAQTMLAFDELDVWHQKKTRAITHIVMMGQGEPLLNLDAVIAAIKIFCDGDGLAFSRRRVTVSTAGIVPAIKRLGEETGVRLAISLHAAHDKVRNQIMPLNKKYDLTALMQACRDYPGLMNSKRITFEYVMLKDINDKDEDARALARLIAGIPAKINLIPFNPWPDADFAPSSPQRIEAFAAIINRAGYAAPIRRARGSDIMAACGQLKTAHTAQKERVSAS